MFACKARDADVAFEAFKAYEADKAKDAEAAFRTYEAVVAVPNNDPVNDVAQTLPLTVKVEPEGVVIPIPRLLPEPNNVGPALPNLIPALS